MMALELLEILHERHHSSLPYVNVHRFCFCLIRVKSKDTADKNFESHCHFGFLSQCLILRIGKRFRRQGKDFPWFLHSGRSLQQWLSMRSVPPPSPPSPSVTLVSRCFKPSCAETSFVPSRQDSIALPALNRCYSG